MAYILDLIIIATLFLCIYTGYKKGLAKVAINLISFVLSVIIALILYQPITNLIINNTEFDEAIQSAIVDTASQEKTETPESSSITTYIQNYAHNAAIDAENTAVNVAAQSISVNVIGIIVLIALFIVSRIGVHILATIIDIVTKLPILKQFNKAGGLIYGALKGLAIIYVVLAIIFFASSLNELSFITNAIDTSIVTKLFYDNNIILNILF